MQPSRSENLQPNAASPRFRKAHPGSPLITTKGHHVETADVVDQRGKLNVKMGGVDTDSLMWLNWFHAVSDMKWGKILFLTAMVYLAINLIFGTVYYIISVFCGGRPHFIVSLYFSTVTLPGNGGYEAEDKVMLDRDTNCFMFRTFLVLAESYTSMALLAVLAGFVVSKASKGTGLRHRVVFSDHALVTTKPKAHVPKMATNSDHPPLHLCFRLGNVHRRAILNAQLRVFLVNPKTSNHYVQLTSQELEWFCIEEKPLHSNKHLLLLWAPCTIVHTIDESSPLRKFSLSSHASLDLQIVALLTGTDAGTGGTLEARHCYRMADIIRGYHFTPKIIRPVGKLEYFVDFRVFNELVSDELNESPRQASPGCDHLFDASSLEGFEDLGHQQDDQNCRVQ